MKLIMFKKRMSDTLNQKNPYNVEDFEIDTNTMSASEPELDTKQTITAGSLIMFKVPPYDVYATTVTKALVTLSKTYNNFRYTVSFKLKTPKEFSRNQSGSFSLRIPKDICEKVQKGLEEKVGNSLPAGIKDIPVHGIVTLELTPRIDNNSTSQISMKPINQHIKVIPPK